MNHPADDWKDDETFKLSKDKECFLDRDIRFANLGDAEDHRRCFEWEYVRTRIFKGQEFGDEIFKQMYPFYVKSFPDKPYKSHDPKQRATWVDVIGASNHDYAEELLMPDLGTNEEVDLGFYKGKIPSTKVGVELYINPDWSKKKFLDLVEKQATQIFDSAESEKKHLESQGYVFPKKDNTRPKSYWQKCLKALGHYRLLECVNLREQFVIEAYGRDAYSEEKIYRREIKNLLPDLPCSWINS